MKKLLAVLVAVIALASPALAKSSGSHKSSGRPKTVHVKEHTKKDGTHVKAHDRAKPEKHAAEPTPRPAPDGK